MKTSKFVPTKPYSTILNEMIQDGYRPTELKRLTGLNYNTVKNIIRNKTPKIKATTAEIISRVYQEYLMDKDAIKDFNTFARGLDTIRLVTGIMAIGLMLLVFMYFAIGNN